MTTAHPVTVRRLEQFLQSYDELMWAGATTSKGYELLGQEPQFPLKGPLLHYRELRKHLLEINGVDEFDTNRFFFELPTINAEHNSFPKYGILEASTQGSWMVASWVTESRRVFNIDPDLQALLGATTLEKVLVDDIKLPFGSFGIQLEHPIHAPDEDRSFDLILYGMVPYVETETNTEVAMPAIMLFSSKLDKWHPTTCRANVERKISRGKILDACALLANHRVSDRNTSGLYRVSACNPGPEGTVGDLLELINGKVEYGSSAVTQAWRIVFGLCLYLTSLPKDSPKVGAWESVEKSKRFGVTPDLSAITDESQICTVSSIRKLNDEDRELLFNQLSGRKAGYEVRAHFRMGHWRRPPRTAQDSDQPKTVWVQPTLVRRDRLPEGAIPHGAQVDL